MIRITMLVFYFLFLALFALVVDLFTWLTKKRKNG
jgi:hypothetical protein